MKTKKAMFPVNFQIKVHFILFCTPLFFASPIKRAILRKIKHDKLNLPRSAIRTTRLAKNIGKK